jgi:D-alanine-D-alanine ligase
MPLVAVVMGGASAERAISLQTGEGVARALTSLGYPIFELDFDGRFVDRISEKRPAAVFNALHGGAGENGTAQAILDWLEVPYQGSGVRASALAMDKWLTKAVMRDAGLPTPESAIVDVGGSQTPPLPARPSLPFVVKPRADGSAIGVTIVRGEADWPAAVAAARAVGGQALVEHYVEGREFTVAILGDESLPVVEISPSDEFYSYHAKYTAGASRHIVPARIPDDAARRMQSLALSLHRALGCRDYSRIDFMTDATAGSPMMLECNTLPGLTPLSLFPDAAAAAGISYERLVERLVSWALSRGKAYAR